MNRRTLIKVATLAPVLGGKESFALGAAQNLAETDDLSPVYKDQLYGNAFDLLPAGTTDTVETIAQVVDRRSVYMLIRNNGSEPVIIRNPTGLVRDNDGTLLSVPIGFVYSSEVIQPGQYVLADLMLGDTLESPEDAVPELTLSWEPFTPDSFVFSKNLTLLETEKTNTRYIGTIRNDNSDPVDSWLVLAFCFNEDGTIAGVGWDADVWFAPDGLAEGDTAAFGITFYYGKPTDRFLIGARTQF